MHLIPIIKAPIMEEGDVISGLAFEVKHHEDGVIFKTRSGKAGEILAISYLDEDSGDIAELANGDVILLKYLHRMTTGRRRYQVNRHLNIHQRRDERHKIEKVESNLMWGTIVITVVAVIAILTKGCG